MGALIRRADSGARNLFQCRQNDCSDSMRSGIWQLAVWGQAGGNDGISCQRVAGPMKSLCQGENAPVGFRLLFSLFLSVCFSHSFVTPVLSLPSSRTSFQRRSVGRGGGNNQRKFDGNIRMRSSDRAMCSDIFEYRPLRHVGRRRCARSINSMRN